MKITKILPVIADLPLVRPIRMSGVEISVSENVISENSYGVFVSESSVYDICIGKSFDGQRATSQHFGGGTSP